MTAHPLLVVTAVDAEAQAVRAGIEAARTRADARHATAHSEHGTAHSEHATSRARHGTAHAVRATGRPEDISGRPEDITGRSEGIAAEPEAIVVEAVGVGPAAAAAGTARLLAAGRYRAVLSAGIAGGFPGRAPLGAIVLGTRSIAADLGAESPAGFLPIEELGFGRSVVESDTELVKALAAALPGAITGDVLTLATVTGTAATAERLAARFPNAVAEAMEGFGVATAAAGLPFAELRAISNPVGPRDRAAWRLKEAFAALSTAFATLWTTCG